MSIKQDVKDLYAQGWGRKRIATALGVSEYRVRTIVHSIVTDKLRRRNDESYPGYLRLTKVKTKKEPYKRACILSDIHIPFHDRKALSTALAYMRDLKPDDIILAGDIVDFYSVSRFQKDPMRIDTIQDELNEAKALLGLLRSHHPNARIFYLKGNHEERLEKFLIDRAPALASLDALSLDELLGLSQYGVLYVDRSVDLGNLRITHGDVARKNPGGSVKAHFEKSSKSVLIGHVHRLNVNRYRNGYGTQTTAENGCLCGLDPDYVDFPNWQHGFSVVQYSQKSGEFFVHQHEIVDGRLVVDDKVYQASCQETERSNLI